MFFSVCRFSGCASVNVSDTFSVFVSVSDSVIYRVSASVSDTVCVRDVKIKENVPKWKNCKKRKPLKRKKSNMWSLVTSGKSDFLKCNSAKNRNTGAVRQS